MFAFDAVDGSTADVRSNVGDRGQSGPHLLNLSSSHFDPKPSFATGEVSEAPSKGVTQSYLSFQSRRQEGLRQLVEREFWRRSDLGHPRVRADQEPPAARASGLELEGCPRTCRTGRRMSRRP